MPIPPKRYDTRDADGEVLGEFNRLLNLLREGQLRSQRPAVLLRVRQEKVSLVVAHPAQQPADPPPIIT